MAGSLGPLQIDGWAHLDLNQGPLPYQGSALTELSYGPACAVRGKRVYRLQKNPGKGDDHPDDCQSSRKSGSGTHSLPDSAIGHPPERRHGTVTASQSIGTSPK